MKTCIAFLCMAIAVAAPGAAQQIMAEYDARLGPQDMVNSSGQRLSDVCAMVQQDRANYHRFGKRDPVDTGDPVFSDPVLRSRISNTCEIEPGYEYLRDRVPTAEGSGYVVRVRVLNDVGVLRVLISERAG